MANRQYLEIITQGSKIWNRWREQAIEDDLDLSGADLPGIDLRNADLHGVNFMGANLKNAKLHWANLRRANLRKANLRQTFLRETNLSEANLTWANLQEATLKQTDLRGADLSWSNLKEAIILEANLQDARLRNTDLRAAQVRNSDLKNATLQEAYLSNAHFTNVNFEGANLQEADLRGSHFLKASLTGANLSECRIYGIAVWESKIDEATNQQNLVVTDWDEPTVSIDDFQIAQFMYLLLHTPQITRIFETVTSRFALIVGHFTPERNPVLNTLRTELRKHQYIPLLLDVQKPDVEPFTKMLSILAHIARFIIADFTQPRYMIEPALHIARHASAPFLPILNSHLANVSPELSAFYTEQKVGLKTFYYEDLSDLHKNFTSKIMTPIRLQLIGG